MFSQIQELALHHQINFLLLVGSGLIVFLLCLLPAKHANAVTGFAPVTPTAKTLTLFYIALTTLIYASSIGVTAKQTGTEPANGSDQLYMILLPLLLYAPLLVSYVLHAGKHFTLNTSHIGAVFAALGGVYACSYILDASGILYLLQSLTDSPIEQQSITLLKTKQVEEVLYIIVGAVIIAPLVEEIFFRGFIFRIICQNSGMAVAAAASGLFFGAVHVSLLQTCALTCFGIIQGILYHKTQSIVYPIIMHVLFNGIAVICIYLY
ncbi:MAG: CPBP family intramembrane metalloprotease [Akkermansia sp.]|nr:CPBP family intramembrane metalloprotease [Akkermansia sp.]MBR3696113.1 CPBP family intramembrane metalloprotease [Akkermansia sp.]